MNINLRAMSTLHILKILSGIIQLETNIRVVLLAARSSSDTTQQSLAKWRYWRQGVVCTVRCYFMLTFCQCYFGTRVQYFFIATFRVNPLNRYCLDIVVILGESELLFLSARVVNNCYLRLVSR